MASVFKIDQGTGEHLGLPATGDVSPFEIGSRLNEIPMSALKHDGSTYSFPRNAFKAMVDKVGS